MGGSSLPACPAARSSFEVAFIVAVVPVLQGQRNFPGLWWSATTDQHVGFESWVERDVAMLLDFDPEVAFAAQPLWLIWPGERGERKHAPDFFARRADGTGVVIDVRPDDLVDPEVAEVFEVTASACRAVGWEFRRPTGLLQSWRPTCAGFPATAIPAVTGPRSPTR